MTSAVYRTSLLKLGLLATGTYQWILTGDGYVPDIDADVFVSDLSDEYGGSSYTRQAWSYGGTTTGTDKEIIHPTVMPAFSLDNDSIHLANLILAEDSGVDASDRLVARFGIDKLGDGTSYQPAEPSAGLIVVTTLPNCTAPVTPPGSDVTASAVVGAEANNVRTIQTSGVGYAALPGLRRAAAKTPPEPTPHELPGVPWQSGHGGYRPPA